MCGVEEWDFMGVVKVVNGIVGGSGMGENRWGGVVGYGVFDVVVGVGGDG